jgi:hypothetical protein
MMDIIISSGLATLALVLYEHFVGTVVVRGGNRSHPFAVSSLHQSARFLVAIRHFGLNGTERSVFKHPHFHPGFGTTSANHRRRIVGESTDQSFLSEIATTTSFTRRSSLQLFDESAGLKLEFLPTY